jgi:hypothetical protein
MLDSYNYKLKTTLFSEKVLPYTYRGFNKFYSSYFKANYTNLPETVKILFDHEDQHEILKNKLKQRSITTFARHTVYLLASSIISYRFFERLKFQIEKPFRPLYPQRALTVAFILGLNGYLFTRVYYIDVSDIVTTKSRFGMYLWFEGRYRLNRLTSNHLYYFDMTVLNDLNVVKYNKFTSEYRIKRLLFYLSMKKHYATLLLRQKILGNVGGSPTFDFKNNCLNEYIDKLGFDELFKACNTEMKIKSNI